jgi:hypothetical protein
MILVIEMENFDSISTGMEQSYWWDTSVEDLQGKCR